MKQRQAIQKYSDTAKKTASKKASGLAKNLAPIEKGKSKTGKEAVKPVAHPENLVLKPGLKSGSKAAIKTEVNEALLEQQALQAQIAEEEAAQKLLEAEIAAELAKDSEATSKLVKEEVTPLSAPREALIVEYAPLIKFIAQKIAARLPANIELDDLMSSGVIGLMDAIEKYDASRDNKFKTYAEFRIRGAILDELRAQDWVPRSVREKAKQLERAYARIEQRNGRQATDDEVCLELGLTQAEYHEMLSQVRSVSLLSFDDLTSFSKADKKSLHGGGAEGTRTSSPYSEVTLAGIKRMIADTINDLPEKQRLVLSLYYYEDLNLKEIGKVLDVTESRVSQLHTQAILRLKARLRNHWDDFVTLFA